MFRRNWCVMNDIPEMYYISKCTFYLSIFIALLTCSAGCMGVVKRNKCVSLWPR